MSSSVSAGTRCPACGAATTGKFCSECGATVDPSVVCAVCRAQLTAGARFCHRCGSAVGASTTANAGATAVLPWAIAGVALLALVAFVAARNFAGATRSSTVDAPSNALPQAGLDGAAPPAPAGPAPDISQLSPSERAERLFDRVMRLAESGKADSVAFFAPMAIGAYQSLDSMDLDQRYDLGRIAEVTNNPEIARAQADTILRAAPRHLLGLTLAIRVADERGDAAAARDFRKRLASAAAAELRTNRPEYERHRADIQQALTTARPD